MKIWLKVGVILIIAILLASSIYVVYFTEPGEETSDGTENTTEETNNQTSEENEEAEPEEENNNGNNNQDFVHTVFVEEASYTTCKPCTAVAAVMDEVYKSGKCNFYYVSLVQDVNDKAKKRLDEEYNVYGYPVVFIDGGYKVLSGGGTTASELESAISAAAVSTRVHGKTVVRRTIGWRAAHGRSILHD